MDRLDPCVRRIVESALMDGPLRRSELVALGITDPDIRRLVRRGHLLHCYGQYVAGFRHPDFATVLAATRTYRGSVVSHFSAARFHEMRTWVDSARQPPVPVDAIWLTRQARTARNERRTDVVLRQAALDRADVEVRRLLRLTTAARTAVDLARELSLREALVTIDHVLATCVTRADLEAVLERQAGWPGVRRARTAVALGDPRSESVLESIARAAFDRNGVPPPELQVSFWNGSQWLDDRVDFWWPQFNTFAEADGLAKYEAATPRERRGNLRRTFHREQRLADLGLEMVRFGWEDAVNDPDRLAERIRSAFARAPRRSTTPALWRSVDLTRFPIPPAEPGYAS